MSLLFLVGFVSCPLSARCIYFISGQVLLKVVLRKPEYDLKEKWWLWCMHMVRRWAAATTSGDGACTAKGKMNTYTMTSSRRHYSHNAHSSSFTFVTGFHHTYTHTLFFSLISMYMRLLIFLKAADEQTFNMLLMYGLKACSPFPLKCITILIKAVRCKAKGPSRNNVTLVSQKWQTARYRGKEARGQFTRGYSWSQVMSFLEGTIKRVVFSISIATLVTTSLEQCFFAIP